MTCCELPISLLNNVNYTLFTGVLLSRYLKPTLHVTADSESGLDQSAKHARRLKQASSHLIRLLPPLFFVPVLGYSCSQYRVGFFFPLSVLSKAFTKLKGACALNWCMGDKRVLQNGNPFASMNVLCSDSRRNRLDLNVKDKQHQQFMLHLAWSEVYTDRDIWIKETAFLLFHEL